MKYFSNLNLKTNWIDFINKQMQEPYFIKIDDYLANISDKQNIFPPKDSIFRCFNFFDIEDTKIVWLGQDPYFNEKQANGLAFSVNKGEKLPPSLKNIFKELKDDLNIDRDNSDLSDWASQGILLLNTILTVSEKNPNSHKDIGWLDFSIQIIERLNNNRNPIIFILLGNQAQKFIKYINQNKHMIITTSHPSPLSCNKGFFGSKIFSQVNMLLNTKINW